MLQIQDFDEKDIVLGSDVHGKDHFDLVVHELSIVSLSELHASCVFKDYVSVILTEQNIDIFVMKSQFQRNVISQFLLENWNLSGKGSCVELEVREVQESLHGLSVQMDETDRGSCHSVGHTGTSAL